MEKQFVVTGKCIPARHYMVNIDERIKRIRKMVENGDYFCINKGRQYGKTTTFSLLKKNLEDEFTVFSISFEGNGDKSFDSLENLAKMFFGNLKFSIEYNLVKDISENAKNFIFKCSEQNIDDGKEFLLQSISQLCILNEKPIVVMIDEVDQASNYESFIKFLGLLRDKYLNRDNIPTFHSVILAGVYDIKNLKLKIRPETEHQYNSPWNIAAAFKEIMELSADGIKGMLLEYSSDKKIEFACEKIANLIFDYTSGYPFLVSRLCQILDREIPELEGFDKNSSWTENGFLEAVKILLNEQNTLFDDMKKKLLDFPEMTNILRRVLFNGDRIPFGLDNRLVEIAAMFGFIKNDNGSIAIANRIFENRLYNNFAFEASLNTQIYTEGSKDRDIFIKNGELDMPLILERFIVHFNDLYGDKDEKFVESEGRKFFLFFLKPIINGTGNYYVEAQTRNERRTDVVVDYLGHQYVIEMKIWHGNKYNEDGEQQICDYLDYLHNDTGYMLTFNFNKSREMKIEKKLIRGKTIFEAFV